MAACKATPDSLFEDQFTQLDDAWGNFDNYDVENGKLVIKPPAGYNTSAINNSSHSQKPRAAARQAIQASPKMPTANPASGRRL